MVSQRPPRRFRPGMWSAQVIFGGLLWLYLELTGAWWLTALARRLLPPAKETSPYDSPLLVQHTVWTTGVILVVVALAAVVTLLTHKPKPALVIVQTVATIAAVLIARTTWVSVIMFYTFPRAVENQTSIGSVALHLLGIAAIAGLIVVMQPAHDQQTSPGQQQRHLGLVAVLRSLEPEDLEDPAYANALDDRDWRTLPLRWGPWWILGCGAATLAVGWADRSSGAWVGWLLMGVVIALTPFAVVVFLTNRRLVLDHHFATIVEPQPTSSIRIARVLMGLPLLIAVVRSLLWAMSTVLWLLIVMLLFMVTISVIAIASPQPKVAVDDASREAVNQRFQQQGIDMELTDQQVVSFLVLASYARWASRVLRAHHFDYSR